MAIVAKILPVTLALFLAFHGPFAAAHLQEKAASEKDVSPPAQQPIPQPNAITAPACLKLNADGKAEIAKIDSDKSYFDGSYFECESDFLDTESNYAPLLKKLGQESFRPYVRDSIANDAEQPPTIRLRSLHMFNYPGNYELNRLDCRFKKNPRDDYPKWVPAGGRIITHYRNQHAKKHSGKWILKIGAADCRFIQEWLQEYDPFHIIERRQTALNGMIILHAGTSFHEIIGIDGEYTQYSRYGGSEYVPEAKSDRAEEKINWLIQYFKERAAETKRKNR